MEKERKTYNERDIKNKALLNKGSNESIVDDLCKQIIKEGGIPEMKKCKFIPYQKKTKLVCYLDIGRLPTSKAEDYVYRVTKRLCNFFEQEVLVIPFRAEQSGGHTRIERIEI